MARRRQGWSRAAGVAVGVAGVVALAAVGAGAVSTPTPSPATDDGAKASAQTAEDADDAAEAEAGGPPGEPPGQQKAKEARGQGRAARADGPVTCEGARNHGEYVSWVARTTPPGPDKDAVVSAAAESDRPPGFRDRSED